MSAADQSLKDNISLLSRSLTVKTVDYRDETLRKDVFDHISTTILPHVPAQDCPPLPVLAYAIRTITKPDFLPNEIPELLTLLGHVNIARKMAVQSATSALKWNKHFSPKIPPIEERRLGRVTQCADDEQQLYRHIVNTCYEVDIKRTFLHGSSEMFWLKMQTYFPGQFSDQFSDQSDDPNVLAAAAATTKTHTYHHDLLEEELYDRRVVGLCCAKFACDAARYMEDPAGYCAEVGQSARTSIDVLFPVPDMTELAHSVDEYLDRALKAVALLERLFGAKDWWTSAFHSLSDA
ncbi:hypothetical protein DAEQUDRAFT_703544 [Daedalea quercina L-15889]|uniref:Uncharacterized protein n=1 Tax=Daedalea quercina L-15889 TaxID=1314783 RepID=A0A165TCE3_9APHY|nr:hypothetical protein DAEQUDRAFT_703544 [Daedalea quercina L-15889]